MKRTFASLGRAISRASTVAAGLVAAHVTSATILEYADYEGNHGTTDAAVRDGFYGHEKSSGAVFVARTPQGSDPQPRAGSGLVYMEIHTSDGDYGSTGGKRIELKMNQDGTELTPYASSNNGLGIFGDVFWYAWSVFVPTSQNDDGKQIMGQWICRWVSNGSTNYNPPMALDLEDGRWILTVKTNRTSTTGQVKFDLGAVQKGQWTDWAFQIKWDRPNSSDDDTGYIRVYKNGTLLDNAAVTTGSYAQISNDGYTHRGANAYQATSVGEAPNFKLGLYKRTSVTWSPSTRVCYYDEIRVGDANETLASISPGGSTSLPAIQTTTNDVTVPEGSSASFGVNLSAQPSANVVVSVTRSSGDTDISVTGGTSLTFTTNNWSTNQTVTLAAAQDADTSAGSATISLTSSGATSAAVTATENDNDVVPDAAPMNPTADTYAAGGSASTNYGTALTVEAKDDGTTSTTYDRIGYLKFDLSSLAASPTSATLVLTTESSTQAGTVTVNSLTNDAWIESGLTWNNRPTPGTAIASASVPTGGGNDVAINVTSYVQNQFTSDSTKIASFALTGNNAILKFASREAASGSRPQLVFTGGGSGAGILATPAAVTVPEGGSATFGVRLSSAPASNVSVSVARVSGDTDVTVSGGASLTFTASNWATEQTVTLAAASDADLLDGTATIRLSATGFPNVEVIATEEDNSLLPAVTASADTYAFGGSTGSNYGTALTVEAKDDGTTSVAYDRIGYLKFDLSSLAGTPTAVELVLSAESSTQAGTITVHQLTSDSWTEGGLNWSNRPTPGTAIGTLNLAAGSSATLALDVGSYVLNQLSSDSTKIVSFALTGNNAILKVKSREAGTATAPTLSFGDN